MADFKDLLKETRGKTVAFMVGALLAALWTAQHFVWGPLNHKAATLSKAIEEEGQKTPLLQSVAFSDGKVQKDIKKLLPLASSSPLVEQVSRIARESDIRVAVLTPQEPVVDGAYQRLSVQIEGEGKYHQVGKFLAALESVESPVMTVERLGLTPVTSPQPHSADFDSFTETGPSIHFSLELASFASAPAA